MAVAVEMDFPGGTLEQYDEVIRRLGMDDGVGHADGYFHWVAATADGIRVVDVWESREHFGRFAAEQLGPITAAIGIAEPAVVFHDVHNMLVRPEFAAAAR